MTEELQTIIIDNGSLFCKVGFSNESKPQSEFLSIFGHTKYMPIVYDSSFKQDKYYGDEAWIRHQILVCRRLVSRGIIQYFDVMDEYMSYIFSKQLKVDPSKHPVLITETSLNPKESRERMAEILFEKFNVPSFCAGNDAVFSFYSSGKTTGIAFESGFGVSNSVPIIDGQPVRDSIMNIPIGGYDMSNYLNELKGKVSELNKIHFIQEINETREKFAYVALNYEDEIHKDCQHLNLTLDSNHYGEPQITINKERFICGEILFKPEIVGLDCEGIDKKIYQSILGCNPEFHDQLFSNIVLSGGTSMMKGLKERIEKEMICLSKNGQNVHVTSNQYNKYSAWTGASMFSTTPSSKKSFISYDEYNEAGVQIVHQIHI